MQNPFLKNLPKAESIEQEQNPEQEPVQEPITEVEPEVTGSFPAFIASKGVETKGRKDGTRYITGNVNGKPFEVECDRIVNVSEDVYHAILPTLKKQKGNA